VLARGVKGAAGHFVGWFLSGFPFAGDVLKFAFLLLQAEIERHAQQRTRRDRNALQLTYALRPLPLFFGHRNRMPLHVYDCRLLYSTIKRRPHPASGSDCAHAGWPQAKAKTRRVVRFSTGDTLTGISFGPAGEPSHRRYNPVSDFSASRLRWGIGPLEGFRLATRARRRAFHAYASWRLGGKVSAKPRKNALGPGLRWTLALPAPGSPCAITGGPLFLRKIAADAKTQGSDQFLFVN